MSNNNQQTEAFKDLAQSNIGHDERRSYRRFRLKNKSSFILSHEWPALGELIDISKGGFSFTYQAEDEWLDQLRAGCMLFGDHESCLNDMPLKVVSDRPVDDVSEGNSVVVRRRSIQFEELSDEQKFLLECFIWINSVSE